jgi:hypothetical protein
MQQSLLNLVFVPIWQSWSLDANLAKIHSPHDIFGLRYLRPPYAAHHRLYIITYKTLTLILKVDARLLLWGSLYPASHG